MLSKKQALLKFNSIVKQVISEQKIRDDFDIDINCDCERLCGERLQAWKRAEKLEKKYSKKIKEFLNLCNKTDGFDVEELHDLLEDSEYLEYCWLLGNGWC